MVRDRLLGGLLLISSLMPGTGMASDDFMSFLESQADQTLETQVRVDSQAIVARFNELEERLIPEGRTSELSDADLKDLYNAAYYAAAYSLEPEIGSAFMSLASELMERSLKPDSDPRFTLSNPVAAVTQILLNTRHLSLAADWIEAHSVDTVPWRVQHADAISENDLYAVWSPSRQSDAIVMDEEYVGGSSSGSIVAVVHPHCAFSRRAMEYYESLPTNSRPSIVWLVSQREGSPIEPILEWNESHDYADMVISKRDTQWPQAITFMQRPVFYRIENGSVTDSVNGWPGSEQAEAVSGLLD